MALDASHNLLVRGSNPCGGHRLIGSESPDRVQIHRLGAGPNAELVEEMGDVIAYRLFADRKALRISTLQDFGNQRQHFSLAPG